MRDTEDDQVTAETLRWGVSRLASRLRAEQPGNDRALTRQAASVLANLRHSGPLAPSELAAVEGLQVQSLTRVLNELEEQGCIARSRSREDRRRQDISLTDAGKKALEGHVRDGNAWLAAALRETLTPAERGLVHLAAELLQQVAASEVTLNGQEPSRGEGGAEGAAPAL